MQTRSSAAIALRASACHSCGSAPITWRTNSSGSFRSANSVSFRSVKARPNPSALLGDRAPAFPAIDLPAPYNARPITRRPYRTRRKIFHGGTPFVSQQRRGGSAPDYGYKQQSDDDRLADCDRKGGYHEPLGVRRMGLCKTCPARDLKGGVSPAYVTQVWRHIGDTSR